MVTQLDFRDCLKKKPVPCTFQVIPAWSGGSDNVRHGRNPGNIILLHFGSEHSALKEGGQQLNAHKQNRFSGQLLVRQP